MMGLLVQKFKTWRWMTVSGLLHIALFFLIGLRYDFDNGKTQNQTVELVFETPTRVAKVEIPQQSARSLRSAKGGVQSYSRSSEFAIQEAKRSASESVGESEIQMSGQQVAMDEESRYLLQVREQIKLQQFYPAPSRQFREEGLVRIRMTLDRMGSVVKIETLQASPFRRLNDAAIKSIIRAAPFGPFPGSLSYERWNITVPFSFELTAGS